MLSVNHGAAGWAQCLWPRLVDNTVTFGATYTEVPDFENTRCMLVWGTNPASTWPSFAAQIMDARQRGAALIVVDPYLSETAAKADIWLQLRPGTDTALALTMLHVIIREGLYDKEFIGEWTFGFDRLKEHVGKYTPEWGEAVTKIPAALIGKAARLYATSKPAAIFRCVSLDMVHDSLQACRAVSILAAVTGNIGIPGGNVTVSQRGETSQNSHAFIGYDLLPADKIPLRRGFAEFPLLCDKLSPVPTAHMPTLWETIATDKPYPVKAALIFGSNVLISYSNTPRVEEAMARLEFIAVCDLFMTPTAQMADIVLPASSWLERDNLISSFQVCPTYTIAQQKAVEVAEARSDVDIVCALARKLGLGEHFWSDAGELYDSLIKPTGLTFEEFKAKKRIFAPFVYRQYEKNGFNTPSGKVELYSSLLEKNRCAPLPAYTEPCHRPRRCSETDGGVSPDPDHGLAAAGLSPHGKPGEPAAEGNRPPAGPPDPPRYRNPAGNRGGGPGHRRDRDGKRGALRRSHPGDPPRRRPGHAGLAGQGQHQPGHFLGAVRRGDRLRAYAGAPLPGQKGSIRQ